MSDLFRNGQFVGPSEDPHAGDIKFPLAFAGVVLLISLSAWLLFIALS